MATVSSTKQQRKTFENFLVEKKLLTTHDLANAHMEQAKNKSSLDDAIIAGKLMDEEKLARAKAEFFRLPYVDLRNQSLPPKKY